MKIITTHLQADFDCLGSMMAAKKLYPDAVIVFPGSQEKNVREYLADTGFPLPYRRLKGFKVDDVRHVIIVDASTRERTGVFADLLTRENVKVHLYDHHPTDKANIKSDFAVIKNRGATCTVFVEIFREKNIDISPEEATLLALGIYEDTGSLTFSSTRKEDYIAAGWLLEKGADLAVVSRYISRELSAIQIETLDTLLKNIETRKIEGTQISVTTASTPRYVGDIAVLLNKIMEMENINALFALIRMNDRIHLIGRSRIEGVDAGDVANSFGGGGHPMAASATIKSMTLPQTLEKLWNEIAKTVEPAPLAEDLMIENVIKASPDETIAEVEKRLTRFDINTMPVVESEKVVGLITRQIVEKAIYHEMASRKVSDFMTSEFAVVNPGTPAYILEDIMLGGRQKLAPVVDDKTGMLVGIITRGILLNKFYKESLLKPAIGSKRERTTRAPATKNVAGMFRERLPENIVKLLNVVADVANKNGYMAYVVGGFVRDLLLRIPNTDIDIVIEGDGIEFAKKLAVRFEGHSKAHKKFKTAVVITNDGFKIDVATARIEYYEHPAALPTVEMSAIRNDLYRRDFSINAMAVRLNGAKPYALLDFFGGQTDLKDHAIRVLHNLSFVEDPTRVFRAVRFEGRYGFTIGKQTLNLVKSAVDALLFNRLSASRTFAELALIFKERRPVRALLRLKELGLLRFIHPALVFDEPAKKLMDNCEDLLAWHTLTFPDANIEKWLVRFMAAIDPLTDDNIGQIAQNFSTNAKIINRVIEERKLEKTAIELIYAEGRELKHSTIYEAFGQMSVERLLLTAAKKREGAVREAITTFLTKLTNIKPLINGNDLIEMGAIPSAKMSVILKKVLHAQLNLEVTTKETAKNLAKEFLMADKKTV